MCLGLPIEISFDSHTGQLKYLPEAQTRKRGRVQQQRIRLYIFIQIMQKMTGQVEVEVNSCYFRVRIGTNFEREFKCDKHASIAKYPLSTVSIIRVIRFDINVQPQILQIDR